MNNEKKSKDESLVDIFAQLFGDKNQARLVYDIMLNSMRAQIRLDALEKLLESEKVIDRKVLKKCFDEAAERFTNNLLGSFFFEIKKAIDEAKQKK